MDGPIYVGAYWGSRREDLEICASRLQRCLALLARVSPLLDRWKPKGRTYTEAVRGDEVVLSQVADALRLGVNRRDVDGTVIEELGWSWSAWNGVSASPAAVTVTCGAATSSVGVPNAFVLRLPAPSDERSSRLYERQVAIDLVLAVAEAWDPDAAVATSSELRALVERGPGQPVVGWINYLAPTRPVPSAIAGAELLPAGAGTVLALGKPWAAVGQGDVGALADVLDHAGALIPIL